VSDNQLIPGAAVEAAAKAAYEVMPVELFGRDHPVTWEKLSESVLGRVRKDAELAMARAALEAAAPHMLSHDREETRLAHVDAVVNARAVDHLEREMRAAKAQALEEAADEMREERNGWCLDDAGRYWINRTLDELRDRAAEIRK